MERCDICNNHYNRKDYIPLVLNCGDTICSRCVESRKNSDKNLLVCSRCFKESSTLNLPTNRVIMEIFAPEDAKKCPLHPRNNVGDLICKNCVQEVCFTCARESHATHEVDTKNNVFHDWQERMISIQETLVMMRQKFLSADNLIENKREYLNWIVDTKFEQLASLMEKLKRDAKAKINESLD